MLEANSDRNIFMIGAVIVGFMLIVAAKGGFKTIWNQIVAWFTKLITDNTATNTGTVLAPALANIDWTAVAHLLPVVLFH